MDNVPVKFNKYKTKEGFETAKGEGKITEGTISFVEDSREIYRGNTKFRTVKGSDTRGGAPVVVDKITNNKDVYLPFDVSPGWRVGCIGGRKGRAYFTAFHLTGSHEYSLSNKPLTQIYINRTQIWPDNRNKLAITKADDSDNAYIVTFTDYTNSTTRILTNSQIKKNDELPLINGNKIQWKVYNIASIRHGIQKNNFSIGITNIENCNISCCGYYEYLGHYCWKFVETKNMICRLGNKKIIDGKYAGYQDLKIIIDDILNVNYNINELPFLFWDSLKDNLKTYNNKNNIKYQLLYKTNKPVEKIDRTKYRRYDFNWKIISLCKVNLEDYNENEWLRYVGPQWINDFSMLPLKWTKNAKTYKLYYRYKYATNNIDVTALPASIYKYKKIDFIDFRIAKLTQNNHRITIDYRYPYLDFQLKFVWSKLDRKQYAIIYIK